MTLRTKLVLSFTGLLLVAILAVGLVASRSIESILVDQVDRVLTGFSDRGPPQDTYPDADDATSGGQQPGGPVVLRREIAEVALDSSGEVVSSEPSGFVDDPDPLPDTSSVVPDGLVEGPQPFDLPAVDSSLEYRAVAVELPGGQILVRAYPLTDVATATAALIQTLLLAGAGVLIVGAGATWLTVERSMAPVQQMVTTAEAIAAGDLGRRVTDFDPETELGRLATSLNRMMANIETAVARERAGQTRLRQFVADASHELRTPLTAITGYSELHRRGGLADPDEQERAWRRVEAESSRMKSLIDDLLTLTRLGQSQPLTMAAVNVAQVARDAAADHAAIDDTRPIRVEAPDSALAEADPERLHQVVSNLLANTRVHTPPGTNVTIVVSQDEGRVEIVVSDDGPGISPDALPHVFDRFYRADPSRSRKSGGSGLGLAIVRAIVEAHGGEVSAANEGGAVFRVSLPRAAPPPALQVDLK